MTAYERMKIREQTTGATPRQEMIFYAKDMVDTLLPDDPSYKAVGVIRNGEIVGDVGIRMDNRKLVNEVPTMEIHAVLNDTIKFRRGDIFEVEVVEEDEVLKHDYWLCFEENNFHDIQRDGKVELCNHLLKWQDADLSIISEWCVVSRYKTSSTGETSDKMITVDNTRRNVLIPYNDRTSKLHQGKRFFIDMTGVDNPKPYELTDLDRTSYIYNGIGCFQMVFKEVQVVPEDRSDLMICDYKEPQPSPPPSTGLCSITYSGDPIVKAGGSAKTFKFVCQDEDNNAIADIIPAWNLVLPPELIDSNQIVISSEKDNEIKLQAFSKALVGSAFILKATATDLTYGDFEAEIDITVGGLI